MRIELASKMASILSPALQDLKVTYQESMLVLPSQETERKSIFLSNIDQILNTNISTAHFFKANPDFPPETVAKRLKIALERVLVPYDFLAGRFKLNPDTSRLEIDCNAAGAGFVVASSDCSLDDLGDLVYPNVGFKPLAVQTLENLRPDDDQPLCVFQVTSFKCGGFVIGISMNHVLLDGISAQIFVENLASQAFDGDKPLAVTPYHDRHLLAARSPPRVEFPHPEFYKPDIPVSKGPRVFDYEREELDYKIFKLTPKAINSLKDKAKDGVTSTVRITSFNVVAALMWRCKALSSCTTEYDKDRIFTLLNAINIRSRINPPLPTSYCGNAILPAYASAKCEDLELWPFSKLVEMVSEGQSRVTDEYAKSVIDWLEINKGLPRGEYALTSWLRLGFDQVVYPWGKPVYSSPVVSHKKNVCWVFHDVDGINALVSLPAAEMERFESYFRQFFP